MSPAVTELQWDEARRNREWTIAVDLGQVNDFTAITVLERFVQPLREVDKNGNQKTQIRFEIPYLERPQLNTPYPAIVERVRALVHAPELCYWKETSLPNGNKGVPVRVRPDLVIDATGCGRPVFDMFKAVGLKPIAVTITGGHAQTRLAYNEFHVPKRDLIGALQVALQNRDVKIAQTLPLAPTLITELQNFRLKINIATGHDSYEAWRENAHDDLVLSAALGFWWGAIEKHRYTGGVYRAIWGDFGVRLGEKIS